MAAIAFDPLEFTHELEATGVPREQAEVHAKAMTAQFIHNFDALVTRDYLDSRFSDFESRLEAKMDRRFGEVDKQLAQIQKATDSRFSLLESSLNGRFSELESSFNGRFSELESSFNGRFSELESSFNGRFNELESNFSRRSTEMESTSNERFASVDVRFERIDGKFTLMYWMQGLTIACVVIPAIRSFLS